MDNFNIRHRSVLRHHYTRTSNVLLFGYRGVGDSAKITYQAIDSFDWTTAEGTRKGYAHPSLGRIANLLGTSERTIRRHLAELEKAGLVTRDFRPGQSSVLYIEDPSADQAEQYLQAIAPDPEDEEPDGREGDDGYSEAPDKIVRPPRTELAAPSIQESQTEERQNNVELSLEEKRRGEGNGDTHIGTTLRHRQMELRAKRTGAADQRAEVLADELCEALGDFKSRIYFRSLARTVPAHIIYAALGQVREAVRDGRDTSSPGALFTHLLQRRAITLGSANRPLPTPPETGKVGEGA